MGDVSAHFSAAEFADKETRHYLPPPAELLEVLEKVRAAAGRPVKIVSGHRCCAHNARVGGATRSRHIYGDAVDISPGLVRPAAAFGFGARGVGVRDGWAVHLDVRPGDPVQWSY